MSGTTSIPLVMGASGPVTTPPATLRQALVSNVAATNPGYTASLPGSLIEDIASTDVGALSTIDQARVDSVNDVTPYGANAYVLTQLGQQFGVPQGQAANGSVLVQFAGSAGYVIAAGFVVGDGTNQYTVSDGTIITSTGFSPQVTAVAVSSGTFAIPANSVTQVVTSVASGYTVTVTNPNAGTPATAAQTIDSYRAQVLQAGIVASTGTSNYLRTLLQKITGVQDYLIAIQQVSGGGWRILCGGGDTYEVGNAILQSGVDISTLTGSALAITGMTASNPVIITTNLNHNYAASGTVMVTGAAPGAYNLTYTIASVTATTITTTTNGLGFGAYTGGATLTPNPRNVSVSLFFNPDTYNIVYVSPPQQIVTISATWNTTLPGFTAGASVNQLAAPAIQNYVNSIYVGNPINVLEMTAVFQSAVASVLPTLNLTTLEFSVNINGVTTAPSAGTSIIVGDPESYFFVSASGATVNQG